jgi:hypothetical protein
MRAVFFLRALDIAKSAQPEDSLPKYCVNIRNETPVVKKLTLSKVDPLHPISILYFKFSGSTICFKYAHIC